MPGDRTLSIYDDPTGRGELMVMAAQLFFVMNADHPLGSSLRFSLKGVRSLEIGRTAEPEPLWTREGDALRVSCPDARMSGSHARLEVQSDGIWLKDLSSKNGTFHNGARIEQALLQDQDIVEVGHTFFLFRSPRLTWSDQEAHPRGALGPALATYVPTLDASLRALADVAPTGLPVLILGETGTGKEVVAKAAHEASRRKGSFIGVNCGALPEHLVESELFGAKRGAFSGAVEDRSGLVRAANAGTLFLDEVGELPPAAQVALLRALQEKEVTPVGATAPVSVDFRLLSATHRDLRAAVQEERFRQDLFARLSGLEVRLTPLRDRKEDLGLLIRTLLTRHERAGKVTLTRRAVRALLRYDWPGNIRELEKALDLATTLAGDDPIGLSHLPEDVRGDRSTETPARAAPRIDNLSEEDQRRRSELLALLEEHHGNVAAVARAMGKARMQIHRWMKRYGIDPQTLRG